jgi:uncharacterized damage-inducible protein DinB
LPEFEEEMKNTRRMLERVPDGKFEYSPHTKSMNLAQLASHVAEVPTWVPYMIAQDEFDMPSDFKPDVVSTRAELLEMFDKGVVQAREQIAKCGDDKWQQNWTFKVDGKSVMQMPRAAVVRSMIMNHMIHHRAQLGVYLRLNDVAVPGMYGPSADEAQTLKAQAA